MGNIITYEDIFELLRKERSTESLQKIDEGFYTNILRYINEKESIGEKEIISNIKKMLKEIYDRRERKIIGLAIDRCRLGSESINTTNLLKDEREIYEKIVDILLSARNSILSAVLSGKEKLTNTSNKLLSSVQSQESIKLSSEDKLIEVKDTMLVRFLHAVPRFVGKELELYGPFEKEEIATLPIEIAKLLIAKARAEEIKHH